MTKEDTLLLYKDLCGRTTYGTKIKWGYNSIFTFDDNHCGIGLIDAEASPKIILSGSYYGDNIKPYLFPLSSMTEEQKEEFNNILSSVGLCYAYDADNSIIIFSNSNYNKNNYISDFDKIEVWLNKNHFDYRGLIPMGLAKNASNLNIY
jgi:hypothetical protein